MPRDDEAYLLDMLLWARRVKSFNEGIDEASFAADIKSQAATLHGLQVIARLPARFPSIFKLPIPRSDGIESPGCATVWSTTMVASTCRSSGGLCRTTLHR
jgi:hypothetical protein